MASDALVLGDYRVRRITTGRWREHCYVVQHVPSAEAVVVDPGEEADVIAATLRADGAVPRYVILTHAHYDHVGALAALGRDIGVPFYLHPADTKLLRRAPMYAMSFERKSLPPPGEGHDVTRAVLHLGGRRVLMLYVPGHTEGGMAYGFEGFAFTGDTLLFEQFGRADLPGGNPAQLLDSVSRLLDWVAGETLLLPGHGRAWNAAEARSWWSRRASGAAAEPAARGAR